VSFWNKKQSLCEIYQAIGMQYAFLSADNDQCHPWIKCRDFLHDALRSHVTGKKDGIYGFNYDPKANPALDLERMRLLVKRQPDKNKAEKDASENTKEMMDSALAILRLVENHAGIKPLSNLYRTSEDKDVYMFEGSSDWMESTFMISLYTFFIRLGGRKITFKDKEDFDSKLKEISTSRAASNDNDVGYLKDVLPFIYKIVEKRKELRYVREDGKRLFEDQTISLFHGYTGVVALSRQAAMKKRGTNNAKLEDLITLSNCIK